MRQQRTIHCDMDGVLVDFGRFIREHLSTEAQRNDQKMWDELHSIPGFYQQMKPTPYASQLWIAIMSTNLPRRILTAVPLIKRVPEAEGDKRVWVEDHKHSVFMGETPEVYVGPYAKDKWRHCWPGDILIDDKEENCVAWETAGGFTVHHTGDIHATIKRLRWLVNQSL